MAIPQNSPQYNDLDICSLTFIYDTLCYNLLSCHTKNIKIDQQLRLFSTYDNHFNRLNIE